MTTAFEIVTFSLKSGYSIDDLQPFQEKINQFLKAQDGFYYRSLSQNEQGTLFDIVYWRDMAAAKAAQAAFTEAGLCELFDGFCDMESVAIQHMEVASEAMMNEEVAEA